MEMQAIFKVGDIDDNLDIKEIQSDNLNDYSLVISYGGKYYGSKFNCDYFEGVTLNFALNKDDKTESLTVGTPVNDVPTDGSDYVRIMCKGLNKVYSVQKNGQKNDQTVLPNAVALADANEVELKIDKNDNNNEIRPAEETGNKSENKGKTDLWSKVKTNLSGIITKNKSDQDNFTKFGGKRSRKAVRKSGKKVGGRRAKRHTIRRRGTRKK
jgi:hypothetical protein